MCIRTVNLRLLSVRWYSTPSQTFRASVRSLTPIRKLCQKSPWQSPAECQEEGESVFPKFPLIPSVVKSGWIRKCVNVCDGACVSAGWSTSRKTTWGACTSYLRVTIQICLAWDVHPASPSAQSRLWQWWEIKHTNKSLSCWLKCSLNFPLSFVQTFTVPSISLFSLECLEGREITTEAEITSMVEEGFNNHVLSVRVNSGWWDSVFLHFCACLLCDGLATHSSDSFTLQLGDMWAQ